RPRGCARPTGKTGRGDPGCEGGSAPRHPRPEPVSGRVHLRPDLEDPPRGQAGGVPAPVRVAADRLRPGHGGHRHGPRSPPLGPGVQAARRLGPGLPRRLETLRFSRSDPGLAARSSAFAHKMLTQDMPSRTNLIRPDQTSTLPPPAVWDRLEGLYGSFADHPEGEWMRPLLTVARDSLGAS